MGVGTRSAVAAAVMAAVAGPASADLNYKTNLALWLDASSGVTVNSSNQVTGWADRAGAGHTVTSVTGTPTLAASGLFGMPAVVFNGNAEMAIAGQVVTDPQSYTFFAVASDTGGTGGGYREIISNWTWANGGQSYFMGTASSSLGNRTFRFTDSIGGAEDPQAYQQGVLPTTTPAAGFFETGLSTATGSALYVDTPTSHQSVSRGVIPARSTSATWRVGSQGSPGERWEGAIAELLVYNAALSDAERSLVYNYLAVKYHFELPGDANRDAKVNGDDYALIDRGYAKGLTGWSNGDFNSDGIVSGADYQIIDKQLISQGEMSPEMLAAREAEFGPGYAAGVMAGVPEPSLAGVGLAALAGAASSRRRRRR